MNVQSVSENNSSFKINYTYNYAMSEYYKNYPIFIVIELSGKKMVIINFIYIVI